MVNITCNKLAKELSLFCEKLTQNRSDETIFFNSHELSLNASKFNSILFCRPYHLGLKPSYTKQCQNFGIIFGSFLKFQRQAKAIKNLARNFETVIRMKFYAKSLNCCLVELFFVTSWA